jgi:hypothetical protein
MSEHDQREQERMSAEARIIVDVCAIGDKPFVETVENHFADDLNELGITVTLKPEASDRDVISVQNELLAYFSSRYEMSPPGFTWRLMFSRGGTSMRSLFPGDLPRTGSEDLE